MTSMLLLLSGCSAGSSPESSGQAIRERYENAASFSVVAQVTADYDDTVYEYKVKYAGDDESGTLQVLSPQVIAGLTAFISDGGSSFVFEDAELFSGPVDDEGLTPIGAIPAIIRQWRFGHISDINGENFNGTRVISITNQITDKTILVTYFDRESLLPVESQLSYEGKTRIICTFEDVIINANEQTHEDTDEQLTEENMG